MRYIRSMSADPESPPPAGLRDRVAAFVAEGDPERPAGRGERLRLAIRERYETTAAFARAAGVAEGLVRQHVNRGTIPSRYVSTYVRLLGVSPAWLLDGHGPMRGDAIAAEPAAPPAEPAETAPGKEPFFGLLSRAARESNASVRPLVGERDLPVYAAAQGGPGELAVTPEPIEYVKRPAPLIGVTGGFAVYVTGDSMFPAYEQGDMILIHPALPIQRGCDALLADAPSRGGDWTAIVKRVEGWTEKVWKLAQFNPKKSFELPRTQFPRAYRIVGKYNRR